MEKPQIRAAYSHGNGQKTGWDVISGGVHYPFYGWQAALDYVPTLYAAAATEDIRRRIRAAQAAAH